MNIKSPFYVVEDFISPLLCEDIVDMLDINTPNRDKNDREIKTVRTCESAETIIFDRLWKLLPSFQSYYNIQYKGTEEMVFEMFPEGSFGASAAENSSFIQGKWVRTKDRDLTAILFLCDYQDQPLIEAEFEVYGGKLEFPQHHFSFNPTRGVLVVFPSDPHFINATSTAYVGDLFQVRIQIAANAPFIYDPRQFPGNYTNWFK